MGLHHRVPDYRFVERLFVFAPAALAAEGPGEIAFDE